jgi:glyoxylase-like metal-dependent hydrolase (beta-lactamase superfamily II)
VRAIDVRHLGRERVICCWQVGDTLVDPGPTSCVDTLLAELDGWVPKALLLTHIHLDHAGASGTLARLWPSLEVYVHERGAPHMIDPEKLLASATRLYGDEMDTLWGAFEPVPEDRLHALTGGEQLVIGDREFAVAYTPGHASHHVSYLSDGVAFVGDVGGVRIAPEAPPIPPTPPPDIDIEQWKASLELIASWRPDALAYTHFGSTERVDEQLTLVAQRLDLWAAVARDAEFEEYRKAVLAELEQATSDEVFRSYMQAVPLDQSYAGLRRYWKKRAEREAA